MGIYSIKPKFQEFLKPVKDWLVRHHISPTTINFLGFTCALAAALIIWRSIFPTPWLLVVPLLVFVRTAFNALDGLVSRELGVASRFGEVLNEMLDRLADTAIFLGIALNSSASYPLATLALVAVLLCSFLGVLSKSAGAARQYGGFMGKADRMFYLGLACIIWVATQSTYWNYFLAFILIGTVITIAQRFIATKRQLDRHAV